MFRGDLDFISMLQEDTSCWACKPKVHRSFRLSDVKNYMFLELGMLPQISIGDLTDFELETMIITAE
jgi:hypothetical protein